MIQFKPDEELALILKWTKPSRLPHNLCEYFTCKAQEFLSNHAMGKECDHDISLLKITNVTKLQDNDSPCLISYRCACGAIIKAFGFIPDGAA